MIEGPGGTAGVEVEGRPHYTLECDDSSSPSFSVRRVRREKESGVKPPHSKELESRE
jgi:hypothetical protein